MAELGGSSGSVKQTFLSSGKSTLFWVGDGYPTMQWVKGMPADAKVDQKAAHTLPPGPITQTFLLP